MRLSTKEALLGLSVVFLTTVLTGVLPGALCLRLLAGPWQEFKREFQAGYERGANQPKPRPVAAGPQHAPAALPIPVQAPAVPEVPVPAPAAPVTLVGTWQDKTGGGMVFKPDGKFVLASGGRAISGTYKIDAEKKAIEMTARTGGVQKGVYSIDGDVLTMVIANDNGGCDYGIFRRKK